MYCKECIAKDSHDYYLRNKDLCKERHVKWKENNREHVKEYHRQYRIDNPDKEFKKQQKYRENHKEQLYLKGKKYREQNREYFYDKAKERKKLKSEVSDNTVTKKSLDEILEKQNYKCVYCGCDLLETGKHLDHILPLSRGGLHTITNIQYTCPTCNMSKGDKTEEEWFEQLQWSHASE